MTRFHCPVEILGGDGVSAAAGPALSGRGVRGRVLVLVDPTCAALGLHAEVCRGVAAVGLEPVVNTEGRPNPALETVASATEAFRGAGAAAIVAVGGGSTLDLAKGVVAAPRIGGAAGCAERFRRLAEVLGAPSAAAVPGVVGAFVRRLAPALSLAALGVPEGDLPALAAAAGDYQTSFNSVRVPSFAALLALLQEAY